MFTNQIQELKELVEGKEKAIETLEHQAKVAKEELRDIKQALASLERVQTKYDPKEMTDETTDISE